MMQFSVSSQNLTGYIMPSELQILKLKLCLTGYSLTIIAAILMAHFFTNDSSSGAVLCVFLSIPFTIVGFASLLSPTAKYEISNSGIRAIFSKKRIRSISWDDIGKVLIISYQIPITPYTSELIDCYAIISSNEVFFDSEHFKHYDERKYILDNLHVVLLPKNILVESFMKNQFDCSKIIDIRN